MPVSKVPNHAHCVQCGKAIPASEDTCGQECAQELEEESSRRKKMWWFTIGLMVVAFLFMFVGPMILGGG